MPPTPAPQQPFAPYASPQPFAPYSPPQPPIEQTPWRNLWLVILGALVCLPIAGGAWFAAIFGGHDYWREYLASGLIWCVPLAALSLARNTVGRASRGFALALAIAGAAFLLAGLSDFLHDPGWQF